MTRTTLKEPVCFVHEDKRKRTFSQSDSKIIEAVDESLASFGESARQVVYFQLKNSYHMTKQDIPNKIEEFAEALEAMFGVGARLIEMKIIEALHAKAEGFTLFPSAEDLMFKEYVENIRSYLLSSSLI